MLDETGIKIISISLVGPSPGTVKFYKPSLTAPAHHTGHHWTDTTIKGSYFLHLPPPPCGLLHCQTLSVVKGYIFTLIIWHAFIHHQKSFWSEWIRYRQLYLLLHTPWCWCRCNGSSIEYWSLQQHVLVQLPAHLNPAHSKYLHNNLLQSKSGDHHRQGV